MTSKFFATERRLRFTFIVSSFIVSLLIVFISKLYIEKSSNTALLNNAYEKSNEREVALQYFISQSEKKLISLRTTKFFEQFLKSGSQKENIEDIFLTYSKSEPSFMQLRYIDKNGIERVRIDREKFDTTPKIIEGNKLQNKSDRYYFSDSKTKELEKVWFSAIDLNIEYGKVQIPYSPTLRAILPIKIENKFGGILIINYFMEKFLTDFANMPLYDVLVYDNNGYTIIHPNPSLSWGLYKENKYNISLELPDFYKQILANKKLTTDEFVSNKFDTKIYNGFNLILKLKKSFIENQQKQSNLQYLIIFIIVFTALVLLSIFVSKHIKTVSNLEEVIAREKEILQHKEQLQIQKEEFESIFKNSIDGIAIVDLTSKFLDCNDAYLKMTGFTREVLLQKSCMELSVPEEQEKSIKAINEVIQNGAIQNFEKTCIVNGKQISVNMSASLLPDKQRILLITKEITGLKLLEKQTRLMALGETIGNIAHQWRQPLSVISTGVTGMQVQKEYGILSDEKFNETCEMINENTQYLSKTIDDFRDYVKGERELKEFFLKDTFNTFLSLSKTTMTENNIQVIISMDNTLMIEGYANELLQCFVNIFNNAKDALLENMKKDRLYFITIKETDNRVCIELKDNAGGVPNEILPKIFDPYFTTKHQSQGTGLGLHMAYNLIVNGMGGTIVASNESYDYNGKEYRGALFTIQLPKKEFITPLTK